MHRDSLASWHGSHIMFGRRCTNDIDNLNYYDYYDHYDDYNYYYDNNNHTGAYHNNHTGAHHNIRLNNIYFYGSYTDGVHNDNIGTANCDSNYDCRGNDSVAGFHLDCSYKGFVRSGEHFFCADDDGKSANDNNNNDIAKVSEG